MAILPILIILLILFYKRIIELASEDSACHALLTTLLLQAVLVAYCINASPLDEVKNSRNAHMTSCLHLAYYCPTVFLCM